MNARDTIAGSLNSVIAELRTDAAIPAVQEMGSRAAGRLQSRHLTAEDLAALYYTELDYRARAAALMANGSPHEVLAFKWRAFDDCLGPEPTIEAGAEEYRAAVDLITAREERRARLAKLAGGMSVGELLATDFPPPNWIVPDLLVSGLTILAGAPKLGKSWLALALGAAVGSGGAVLGRYRVERRRALYLALEDTPRRLKDRLEKIGASPGSLLDLFTQWRNGAEGLADLDACLTESPEIKLVLIDTLARFRGPPSSDDRYSADYAAAASIKEIADRHECAIVVVHHVRKATAEDIMDMVSGSNGLNGAADSTWILTRARGEADASLFVTGRDIEEQTLALRFDRECGTWAVLGDAEEYNQTNERRAILRELEGQTAVRTGEIAKALGKTPQAVSNRLRALEAEGLVHSPAYGKWAIKTRLTSETVKVKPTEDLHGLTTYTGNHPAFDPGTAARLAKMQEVTGWKFEYVTEADLAAEGAENG